MRILRTRRVRAGLTLATVGVLALGAACSSSDNSKSASKSKGVLTPEAVTIRAGVSDPAHSQIAVLQFMPAKATGSLVSAQLQLTFCPTETVALAGMNCSTAI